MTASVTSGAPALDINSITNPKAAPTRKITADLNAGTVDSSNVANSGNTKLFDAANKKLGKQDFLQLLVTQMRYQDPLQPAANTEFVAQLAQFSNLEGTQNINSSIEDLGKKIESMVSGQAASASSINNSSATSLIGKKVRVNTSDVIFDPTSKKPLQLNVHLDSSKNSVLSVIDDKEEIINAIELPNKAESTVSWNGKTLKGTTAPGGKYHLKVTTTDGATDTGYSYLEDKVTGINYTKDGMRLEIRGQSVAMDKVVHVSEDATTP